MKHKSILYKNEQDILVDKIIEILELDENNQITLYDLENDQDKIKKIMDLIPELRKYFSFNNIKGLESPEKTKRPWLSIIRQITKNKYTMVRKYHQINKGNNLVLRTTIYTFIKK